MYALVADKREELAELCRRYDVVCLEVFGFVDALREALERPVDLVDCYEFCNPVPARLQQQVPRNWLCVLMLRKCAALYRRCLRSWGF